MLPLQGIGCFEVNFTMLVNTSPYASLTFLANPPHVSSSSFGPSCIRAAIVLTRAIGIQIAQWRYVCGWLLFRELGLQLARLRLFCQTLYDRYRYVW